ncbi:MAG: FMN-binding protein [Planctomycetes bacterium]|nr:FMN-binding protein [Planctomycetota bacterium]
MSGVVSDLEAASKKTKKISDRDVKKMIAKVGKEKPDWWEATNLNYPKSLNFQTIDKSVGKWNNSVNVNQWIWDKIHPNEKKWNEGIKTIHLIRSKFKDDKNIVKKCNLVLGRMYHDLIQDFARSAYYLQEGGVGKGSGEISSYIQLGNAYLQLGSKKMALSAVKPIRSDGTEHGMLTQLYADMGDYKKAIALAQGMTRRIESTGYLKLGDIARVQGDYKKSLAYYQQAVKANKKKSGRRHDETVRRANENIKAITLFEQFDISKTKDGDYRDKSYGYSGDVEVIVSVKDGEIAAIKIGKHKEKQYYASLEETPRKIIEKQTVQGIDATLGATITSEAVLNAVAKAVNQGR